ncbi:MAG: ABC transporter permease [Lachnospiraceae bacterium]|nr:ABC transporter permease [Lachnospiraceae bacterium]
MIRFVIKRILSIIPVLLAVAIVIFTILYLSPGDPIKLQLGDNYSPEQYQEMAKDLGLDQPYIVQLGQFLYRFFIHLDFGKSWVMKTDIATEIFSRLPRTFIIAAFCCLLQIVVAIPLGITAATHQNGIVDRLCILLAMIGISLPGFWVGLMFILLFSVKLNWLPTSGIEHWYSYIMPIVANALMGIGSLTRMTRSQMLEVIRSDYVVTARAKGVPERTILYGHALPNALIPIVTFVGTHFGRALGGTVVIETVFAVPGIGYYIMDAVRKADYPIVRSGVTLLSLLFCIVILIIDILYAFIDPRIKAQYERGGTRKKVKTSGKGVAANA